MQNVFVLKAGDHMTNYSQPIERGYSHSGKHAKDWGSGLTPIMNASTLQVHTPKA
jgi:hypothetical protein